MRIPPPKSRIDVKAASRALARGETVAAYARGAGHTAGAVYDALRRAGVRVPRRRRSTTDWRLYSLWRSLLDRCEKPGSQMYARYGAKGIRVCRAWHEFPTFQAWARANGYRHGRGLSLRVHSRGYTPSNCSWEARGAVARDALVAGGHGIRAFGETKSASAWSRDPRAMVSGETIRARILAGVPARQAITAKRVALGRQGKRRNYRRIDWKRARKLHVAEGRSVAETARLLRVSPSGVRSGLRWRGWLSERPSPIPKLKHGAALNQAWRNLRHRRGSSALVPAWREFASFHAWALRSGYRKGLVLARLDRSEPHGPKNCVWLPRREAHRLGMPRRVSRTPRWTVTAFGETKGAMAWSRDPRCTVTLSGLLGRLEAGWKPEDAITGRNYRAGVEIDGGAIEAFGVTKSLAAWARDRRARVNAGTIAKRIRRGMGAEEAIATPAFAAARP